MTRIYFEEVTVIGEKTWKDASGKRKKARKKFYQTLSQFNVDCQGRTKSREQIVKEIMRDRALWLAKEGA
jgi:hypothetical protein